MNQQPTVPATPLVATDLAQVEARICASLHPTPYFMIFNKPLIDWCRDSPADAVSMENVDLYEIIISGWRFLIPKASKYAARVVLEAAEIKGAYRDWSILTTIVSHDAKFRQVSADTVFITPGESLTQKACEALGINWEDVKNFPG